VGAFEHVLLLLSFVYALAIAHLLTTVARLIGARERVRFSWFHAFWMANALLLLVVDWISWWPMHTIASWPVTSIFAVLAQSFADYMQAALVCPEIPSEGEIDLVAFHKSHARRYMGAAAASMAVALCNNLYLGGNYNIADFMTQNIAVIPFLGIGLFAALVRRRWVNIAAPLLLSGIWVYYLVELQVALK
jgi:hypothetical protein